MNELEELNLLNQLIELGAKAAHAHAQSNSDDGHKGTAAYVQWHELRAEMGELIRAAYAPQADSVLEDAEPDIDAAFEAVRRGLCKIPRYSFALDSRGNIRRCEDKSGNWIEFDEAHALFDPVAVDAARKQGANHD